MELLLYSSFEVIVIDSVPVSTFSACVDIVL